MEVQLAQKIHTFTWVGAENLKNKPHGIIPISRIKKQKQVNICMAIQWDRRTSARVLPKVSSSLKDIQGSVMESGGGPASLSESLILKKKSKEIESHLNGRCIYLVGMMGSGKTTIGRMLSEVLAYSFVDCDSMIEEIGGMSVAEIFKQHGESFFRDKETQVLESLSTCNHTVVSTGGGAVTRPINWRHMQKGISVWIDVPIDCLARRISSVGTSSRPLLDGESGDAYTKALTRLSTLFRERSEAYANANVRVSLPEIAAKPGHIDVDNLTPLVITLEVLEQIKRYLTKDESSN